MPTRLQLASIRYSTISAPALPVFAQRCGLTVDDLSALLNRDITEALELVLASGLMCLGPNDANSQASDYGMPLRLGMNRIT
jgi:hypothetical protein